MADKPEAKPEEHWYAGATIDREHLAATARDHASKKTIHWHDHIYGETCNDRCRIIDPVE